MQHTDLPLLGQPSLAPLAAPTAWREALRRALRDPRILEQRLALSAHSIPSPSNFPLLVPESFLARMTPGDPADPLLLQVLPSPEEEEIAPGFTSNPVGDQEARQVPGLLQKYHGRALLLVTGACAVHCRYCFRRDYPYEEDARARENFEPALEQIRQDPSVGEIILSGGDPLTRSDDYLAGLARRLAAIPHLHTLRLHTRLPIVLPERVDTRLVAWLADSRLQKVIVVHVNHPNELAGDVPRALADLRGTGAILLNQAVLLRRVNDDVEVLEKLSRGLVALGVLPYYLHQLDRVRGAHHFEVPENRGLEIIEQLRQRLPGYLVPRYVREVAGEPHKTPLNV